MLPTSALFYGEEKKLFVGGGKFHEDTYSFFQPYPITKEQLLARREEQGKSVPDYFEIMPYFIWAKQNLGRKRFFSQRPNDQSKTDTFHFNGWSAVGVPSMSRETLQGAFEVLKLGGITLPEGVQIGGRNLDFVDLDYLTVAGKYHGSIEASISFSTCKQMTLHNTNLHHYTFSDCDLEDFACIGSELYQFTFIRCRALRMRIADSHLRILVFDGSILPDFIRCDLTDVSFRPDRAWLASSTAGNYRILRSAFQQEGKRQEASQAYYLERTYERKALFDAYRELKSRPPSASVTYKIPKLRYGDTLRSIWTGWERGTYSKKDSLKYVMNVLLFKVRVWLPPYFLQTLGFKIKWLFSYIQSVLWGYGERPVRILLVSLCVITFFSCCYYVHIGEIDRKFPSKDELDAVYFSIVTFTTVGFGDTLPKTDTVKLISCSEALIGAFLMGLAIAGFSNKSRY